MTTVITGKGVPLFRLLALRGACRLEAKGIICGRRNARAIAKKELGLKRNATNEQILKALDEAIEEARNKLEPGDIRRTYGAPELPRKEER